MKQLSNPRSMNGLFQCEYYDVHASTSQLDYRVFVATPDGASTSGEKYPVVYSLDGNLNFASVVQTHRSLAMGGKVPQDLVR